MQYSNNAKVFAQLNLSFVCRHHDPPCTPHPEVYEPGLPLWKVDPPAELLASSWVLRATNFSLLSTEGDVHCFSDW